MQIIMDKHQAQVALWSLEGGMEDKFREGLTWWWLTFFSAWNKISEYIN
jgi:hypothetical protein